MTNQQIRDELIKIEVLSDTIKQSINKLEELISDSDSELAITIADNIPKMRGKLLLFLNQKNFCHDALSQSEYAQLYNMLYKSSLGKFDIEAYLDQSDKWTRLCQYKYKRSGGKVVKVALHDDIVSISNNFGIEKNQQNKQFESAEEFETFCDNIYK